MTQVQTKAPFDSIAATVDRRLARSYIWLILTTNAILLFLTVYPHAVYIRDYPQDVFGFLDGIHRVASGQIPNRDFSTPLGPMFFALPGLFTRLGANPVLSLAYAQAALIALNLVLVLHLVRTRLPGLLGLLFALWTSFLLAARMNLGEDMRFVTFALSYNRYCTVFLSELLIFFIPPKNDKLSVWIIDVFVLAILVFILFFSKITYFAVALAALLLLSLSSRANARRAGAAAGIFAIAVVAVELAFGLLGGYFAALLMALRASGAVRGSIKGLIYLAAANLPELLVCFLLPIAVLYAQSILRFLDLVIFSFVAVASLALLDQNGQMTVLAVPFTLLFIALDIIARRTATHAPPTAAAGLLYTAIFIMSFWYYYPLIENISVSFAKSISTKQAMGPEPVTKHLLIYSDGKGSGSVHELLNRNLSQFEVFSLARDSATGMSGMPLSVEEVAIVTEDGVAAARQYCSPSTGIFTLDMVDPFPAILDGPPGGKMIFMSDHREISEEAHFRPRQMFRNVACILVPKLPINYPSRRLLWQIYGGYIKRNFTLKGNTDYWQVYSKITAPAGEGRAAAGPQ